MENDLLNFIFYLNNLHPTIKFTSSHSSTSISFLHVQVSLNQFGVVPGGGGTPYHGLYGEAPPERGTFLRFQVYKRVGISQV